MERELYGATADGAAVERFTLTNRAGLRVRLISYGAAVTELHAPDRAGRLDDVVLGFDNLAQYETESPYFGCTVGRVAFRITEGRFTLDGREHRLSLNAPPHHLHGGSRGLSRVVWHGEPVAGDAPGVRFSYRSPDGDQGYPGALDAAVVYKLVDDGLRIDYAAACDRPTPVNLTHHGYFNLAGAGAGAGDVLGHVLQLEAARYTPLDEKRLPTGAIAAVAGTPYDFRRPTPIGARLDAVLSEAGGYDLSYLRDAAGDGLARAATLHEPRSGRTMEVWTTQPAVVLYTGNYLDGSLRGKGGAAYRRHAGVCLETAHLPDSVNRPEFPSIVLRPGQTYRHTCLYRFVP